MPWSANRLISADVVDALTESVRLEPTSPTYLVWREDYTARKVQPGKPAGYFEPRVNQFIITAKGYPLYVRHAVWILANGRPIPHGYDVAFANTNTADLTPENLALVPMTAARQRASRAIVEGQQESILHRSGMPDRVTFDHQKSGCLVTVHVRRDAYAVAVVEKRQEAIQVATIAATCFGYLPNVNLRLPDELQARTTRICSGIFTPSGRPLTPAQVNIKERFLGLISTEVATLHRLASELAAVEPVAAATAAEQSHA